MTGDDGTKESQVENNPTIDPVSDINTVLERPNNASPVFGDLTDTHCAPSAGSKFLAATVIDIKPHFHYSAQPPSAMISFCLPGGNATPAAAVPIIHISPFDPGPPPLVITRSGFSGIFPYSSLASYTWALNTSVPNVIIWCDDKV